MSTKVGNFFAPSFSAFIAVILRSSWRVRMASDVVPIQAEAEGAYLSM